MTASTTKGERTRARLVETTATLLQRQGFHATGLAQILAESGTPRGSLYFYFPGGKEQLACAALSESGGLFRERLSAAISAAPDFGAAIIAACELLATSMAASDWHEGCPLATVALEAAATSEPVRQAAATHYQTWEVLIAERLTRRGVAANTAAQLATFMLASIEGAMLLAKVQRSAAPLTAVGQVLSTLVRQHLPASSPAAAG